MTRKGYWDDEKRRRWNDKKVTWMTRKGYWNDEKRRRWNDKKGYLDDKKRLLE